jgi:hypothetical protein
MLLPSLHAFESLNWSKLSARSDATANELLLLNVVCGNNSCLFWHLWQIRRRSLLQSAEFRSVNEDGRSSLPTACTYRLVQYSYFRTQCDASSVNWHTIGERCRLWLYYVSQCLQQDICHITLTARHRQNWSSVAVSLYWFFTLCVLVTITDRDRVMRGGEGVEWMSKWICLGKRGC